MNHGQIGNRKTRDEDLSRIITILELQERDLEWVRKMRDGNGTEGLAVWQANIEHSIDSLGNDIKRIKSIFKWMVGVGTSILIFLIIYLIRIVLTTQG